MERRAWRTGEGVAAAVIVASLAGCDLSYLTAGTGTGGAGGGGGSGGGGGTSAAPVAFSVRFGDPLTDDNVDGSARIHVAPMENGDLFVVFHASGAEVSVAGGAPSSTDTTAEPDVFVARIDGASGEVVNAVQLPMKGGQLVLALAAADPAGPFYVAGRSLGPLELDPGVGLGDEDCGYVLRLDQDLQVTAALALVGDGFQSVNSLFVDPLKRVWAGGEVESTLLAKGLAGGTVVDLPGEVQGSQVPATKSWGGFVLRLDGDLSTTETLLAFWASPTPNKESYAAVRALAADDLDNVYVGGVFQGTLSVGPAPPMIVDGWASFVAKVAGDGSHWSRMLNTSEWEALSDLALSDGSVVAVGQGGRKLGFPATTSANDTYDGNCLGTHANRLDGIAFGLDPLTGECQWAARLASGGDAGYAPEETARALALDSSGDLWIAGTFGKQVLVNDLDAGLNDGSLIDSYVLRLSVAPGPAFGVPFSYGWSGQGNQLVRRMALLPDGRVAVVGSYNGALPGGAPALETSVGIPHDYFLMVVDPAAQP